MEDDGVQISLVVASSNRLEALKDFLESLSRLGILSRTDIEVIVVDNHPVDKRVKELTAGYKVNYLLEKNPGESVAINRGIEHATGKYVAFTDDDVIVRDPRWLDIMSRHFDENPKLGYVSGNVVALETSKKAQAIWEKKGGLSKGKKSRLYTQESLRIQYQFSPWPINRIAVGANSMIPKKVFDKTGYFCTFLGGGAPIGHGNSLEMVYRIIKAGYELFYDAEAMVYHKHPQELAQLRKKLYTYGVGNSAYQLYIFLKHGDLRSLYWALFGHHLYVLRHIVKGFFGLYPLPFSYSIYSFIGSIVGIPLFCIKYFARDRGRYH